MSIGDQNFPTERKKNPLKLEIAHTSFFATEIKYGSKVPKTQKIQIFKEKGTTRGFNVYWSSKLLEGIEKKTF